MTPSDWERCCPRPEESDGTPEDDEAELARLDREIDRMKEEEPDDE